MILTAIVFLLILSVLVLIHEAGHFFVAKKLGIKVEEFGFGMPPRIFGKKIGETIYSINLLPIGGFVKLYGEDDAGGGAINLKSKKLKVKDESRAFYARSVGQRAAIVVAGVVMNAVLAVAIFYVYLFISNFKAELPLFGDHRFIFVNEYIKSELVISNIAPNSPAEKIGLRPFSKILSVNGEKPAITQDFIKFISEHKGKEITLDWQDVKTKKIFSSKITPRVSPPKGEGALGVAFFLANTVVVSYDTPVQKIFSGFIHPINLLVYNFDVIGKLASVSVKEKSIAPLGESVSGPVGIFKLVGDIVAIPETKERILQVLNLAGILSISLAFFNVLPIPALDGGRLFFIIIEAVTRKKVNQKFESFLHTVFFVILLTLIILITIKDLTH